MIDPRTTNIIGAHVRLVRRSNPAKIQARGVVRVVDYNHGAFSLLIEALGAIGEGDEGGWYCMSDGELFQVSLFDESTAVVVANETDDPLTSSTPCMEMEALRARVAQLEGALGEACDIAERRREDLGRLPQLRAVLAVKVI